MCDEQLQRLSAGVSGKAEVLPCMKTEHLWGSPPFRHLLASYSQTHGYKRGSLLDAQTLELQLDTEAGREVLELMKVCVYNFSALHITAL